MIAGVALLLLLAGYAAWDRWGRASEWGMRPAEMPVRRESQLPILLVTIDTLRADALGASGNARARTSWMDRLAAGGVRFTRAYAHNVVTLPSHANILSGRYPFEHGVHDNAGFRFPAGQPTLATLLQARGYRTGAFVSAFPLDSRFGLDRGFEVYDDSFVSSEPQAAFLIQERAGTETVARARAWLETPDPRPAFCWVHLYEPHFPYSGGYDGDVAAADSALAPLLDPILNGTRRMLVVVTSDHGESLGEHGEATHGIFAYESTLKVPLVLYAPGIFDPSVVDAPVRHIDLLPTILDAVGIGASGDFHGRSLLPLAAGARLGDRPIYFEALSASFNRGWAPLRGVLQGNAKYVQLPIAELYDLQKDSRELRNLAADEGASVRGLEGILAEFTSAQRPFPGRETSETLDRLRSLGYASPARAASARPPGVDDDPKKLIALDTLLEDVVGRYLAGDLTGALRQCRELVRQRPTMAVSLLHLAHLERESGNLAAGIDALRKATALTPDDATALSLLAAYLSEAGRTTEALAAVEQPAARSDADLQLLVAYGLTQAKAGRYRESLATFERARTQDPSNGRLLVERGTVYLMAGDRERAGEDFEAAVALNPEIARAHSSLGVLAVERGRPGEAVVHWRHAVAADAGEYQKLLALGLFHWRAGRRAQARPYLDFFLDAAPPARYARERAAVREMLAGSR